LLHLELSILSIQTSSLNPALRHTLANGLTVILHPIPLTDAVTVDIWVRTGGHDETAEQLGISHFLEHMVFKGTERLAPGALDQAIEGRGGITNASTGQDYTHYYITVASADLADSLPYLTEVVTQPAIPPVEFDRERQVVLEEMRRAGDSPDYLAHQSLLTQLYPDHPYGRPVLGTEESVGSLTPEAMRDYHRSRYSPEQLTVVVVGGIDPDATLDLITQQLGHLLPAPSTPIPPLSSQPSWATPQPLDEIQRSDSTHPRLEQARLLMAWPTISVQDWDVACGLDLIAAVLGEGRTSRLVRLLREQRGWVRGVAAGSIVQQSGGFFSVSAHLDPSHLEVVEQAVVMAIQRLHEELISEEELNRSRRMLLNEFVFSTESPSQLASLFGYYDVMGSWIGQAEAGMSMAHRYLEQIQSLQSSHLQALARRYLNPTGYVVTTLRPERAPHSFVSSLEMAVH
jgi:predicted Zn-dependent peptidase